MARLWCRAAVEQAKTFLESKQSRKCVELGRHIQKFLIEGLLDRASDSKYSIRAIYQDILRHALLTLESDLATEEHLSRIFIPLLEYTNKIIVL